MVKDSLHWSQLYLFSRIMIVMISQPNSGRCFLTVRKQPNSCLIEFNLVILQITTSNIFQGKTLQIIFTRMEFSYSKVHSYFDLSFNKISNKKQFDVHLIYFDEAASVVQRRFICSQFMGPTSLAETSDNFKDVHVSLDYVHNMVQISVGKKCVRVRNISFLEKFA